MSKINFAQHATAVCNTNHFAVAVTYTPQGQSQISCNANLILDSFPVDVTETIYDFATLQIEKINVAQPKVGDSVYDNSLPLDVWTVQSPITQINPALWRCLLKKRKRTVFN